MPMAVAPTEAEIEREETRCGVGDCDEEDPFAAGAEAAAVAALWCVYGLYSGSS